MAERGIRWIRLALYFVGALGLTALAFFANLGRGKLGGRPDAAPRDADAKPDTFATRLPDAASTKTATDPAGTLPTHRRTHLQPQVREPKAPPSWESFDNSDMNLE